MVDSPDSVLIDLEQVVKIFSTPAGEFPALRGVTAQIHRGEFVSIVGKSGSGKSTLINMITGIDNPTSGRVCVGDTCIQQLKESDMAVWRGRTVGIVFQFFQLLPSLTTLENVLLPMDLANVIPAARREQRALELLDLLELTEFADMMPSELSGGQQQMAAIARALANDPPLIVADEPTGNLDTRTAEAVFEIFGELSQQGKTILMVTHDPALAERTGRMVLIFDGELIDEAVGRAFPDLPHAQLLWLTKEMNKRQLQPGQRLDVPPGSLWLVSNGRVEVGASLASIQSKEIIWPAGRSTAHLVWWGPEQVQQWRSAYPPAAELLTLAEQENGAKGVLGGAK